MAAARGAKKAKAKAEPTRKKCKRCGRTRVISKFRLVKTSGYRQAMCRDCEREYDLERWHNRTPKSRRNSGGAAADRRRARAAA